MYIKASRSSALSDLKSGVMTVDQLKSTGDAFTNVTNVRRVNGFLINFYNGFYSLIMRDLTL